MRELPPFKESKVTDSPFFISHPEAFVRGRKAGAEAARAFIESQKTPGSDALSSTQLEAHCAELAGRSEGHADYVIWLMNTLDNVYQQGVGA